MPAGQVCDNGGMRHNGNQLSLIHILWHALSFLRKGLRCLKQGKIKVELLDAVSIFLSMIRRDFATAGSVMFLLELGELLEEWTRKKSVQDLAQCMSLNVDRVWLSTPAGEVLTPVSQIRPGDQMCIRDRTHAAVHSRLHLPKRPLPAGT